MNKKIGRMFSLCAICIFVLGMSIKLASGLPDHTLQERLTVLGEQQSALNESASMLTEELETTRQNLADEEASLRAVEAERDELAAELGDFKQEIDESRQVAINLEDMYYGHYMDLFFYDDLIGALTDNNDIDGAVEMENRDGVVNSIITFIDNPLINMVTADQQAQRGQISGALIAFNQTFSEVMGRYTPELIKITKMESEIDNYLTLAEEISVNPKKLRANMEIIRGAFGDEITTKRFEKDTADILGAMLRIEVCLDMALRTYKAVLADSDDNRDFLKQMELLLDSTRTCYNKYYTEEMDTRNMQFQQERDEINLTMLNATKKLMDVYCSNRIAISELGPGISSNSRRIFKAGIGYVEIHARFKKTGSGNQLLTAFEYADTGMGSHMMAVHYYDLDGQVICIDSQHSGVTIYLKDGVVLDSTVEDTEKYIAQSQRLRDCILYGDLNQEYFNGIHFETVHRQ